MVSFRYFWYGVIIVTDLLLFVFLFSFLSGLKPVAARAAPAVPFFVDAGDGFKEISERLARMGIVRSAGLFRLYSFFSGSAHSLKPGNYRLSRASTTPEILEALVLGVPGGERVLIVEGETFREIERKLAAMNIIDPGELAAFDWQSLERDYPFLAEAPSLEGFLFPDTYRFSLHAGAAAVVRAMLDVFRERALPLLARDAERLYERLIIASLLEKEVPSARDREIVAGVIEKRLARNLLLQVDATVVYAKCGGFFAGCSPLSRDDFAIDSPYNTYRAPGLPPAPISNPGVAAITAAMRPAASPFLFYLSDPRTKETVFAKTFDEHAANRARYLGL